MKVELIRPSELTPEFTERWSELQKADAIWSSPYFRPEFVRAVGDVRNDVEIAILEEGGVPRGIFPFQRGRWGQGVPVGGPLSDNHGMIVDRALHWRGGDLLRECRLKVFDFDHLPSAQSQFLSEKSTIRPSWQIDLSDGCDAYFAERKQAGTSIFADLNRKRRKLEREHGPLRFEWNVVEGAPFEELFRWKSAQYLRSGLVDLFQFDWTRQLLRRVHQDQSPKFRGVMSGLYAGDGRLIAVHFGMQSDSRLHSWFPAYDEEFARYSPGLLLFLSLIEHAPRENVRRIELGTGTESYKQSLSNVTAPLCAGSVQRRSLVSVSRRCWCGLVQCVKSSPLLARTAAGPAGWLRRLRQQRALQ